MEHHTEDFPYGWHVTEDAYGEPTLWFGATAVFRESDFAVAGAEYRDQLWDVLTAVLAPDEATVDRLTEASCRADGLNWNGLFPGEKQHYRDVVQGVLAALADTSAQARHTADDDVSASPSSTGRDFKEGES